MAVSGDARCWKTRSHSVPSQEPSSSSRLVMSPGRNSTGSVLVPVRRRASVSIVCAGVDAKDRARRSDPSGEGAGDVAGAAADVDEVVAEA